MNTVVLILGEATVTVYPADASGAPVLDAAIWTGVAAENLSVRDRWLKAETRPTGARYPRRHPLVPQFEVAIGRVWALPLGDLVGFVPDKARYVLDAVWRNEEDGSWHRKTFYGVTISERSLDSREVDGGHIDNQVFDAEYEDVDSGTGPVPALAGSLPHQVRFIGGDGTMVPLYRYDPVTHAFAETTAGVSAGRATIGEDGEGLKILFIGAALPALVLDAGGGLQVDGMTEGVPHTDAVPRLEFVIGSRRVGSLAAGKGWFGNSVETDTQPVADGFVLLVGGVTRGSIAAPQMMVAGPIATRERAVRADSDQVRADSTQMTADRE